MGDLIYIKKENLVWEALNSQSTDEEKKISFWEISMKSNLLMVNTDNLEENPIHHNSST